MWMWMWMGWFLGCSFLLLLPFVYVRCKKNRYASFLYIHDAPVSSSSKSPTITIHYTLITPPVLPSSLLCSFYPTLHLFSFFSLIMQNSKRREQKTPASTVSAR
ncbi:MAG: hypothetical protein JOS17DRAFT_768064 [Linnemannia elongata]|nr:MAG: hypothetical protein JOS17DRAFT_768064 [Linnemannia elongata]